MATISFDEMAPLPLPKGLPTIELPKISLTKLLNNDETEAQTLFDICTRTGFFYLDLMDHPKGRRFWEGAVRARSIGQHVMSTLSMEEKDTFLKRPEVGILDRGYQSTIRDENGQTKFVESINLPSDELFAKETSWEMPTWLKAYESNFKDVIREGNNISNIMLGILEQKLQLAPGALTSCHRLTEPSHSFLRILRYPGLVGGMTLDKPRFFAHRDIVSIAMLFTWVSGLQIPAENAEYVSPDNETEDSWRWVEPLGGHAIVNLGDAMPIFTNGKLKSGKHRVVTAYKDQSKIDRTCVLVSSRPAHETPMKAFHSPLIPEDSPGQANATVMTSEEWGDNCVKVFIEEKVRQGRP